MDLLESYKSPLGKLRIVGFIEGASYILLLAIGMPLKYGFGMPTFVRVLGTVHGVLFVWLCMEIAKVVFGKDWPKRRGAIVFLASLIPLGQLFIDGWLKKQQAEFEGRSLS